MQVLILYYSRSGNTEKLAQEIAKGVEKVEGVDCILKTTADVTKEDFVESDAIIAGSPVYFGGMAAELKAIFDKFIGVRRKMGGKIGAAFATSGDMTGGKETTMLSILQALLIYGMVVMGDPLEATGHYGVACVAKPDVNACDSAQKMGRCVAELVKKIAE
ncbi:MAG: flavodoxin family protein [Candidatus Sumerlaeia bacterium]